MLHPCTHINTSPRTRRGCPLHFNQGRKRRLILPRIGGRVKSSERLFQKVRKELTEHGPEAFPCSELATLCATSTPSPGHHEKPVRRTSGSQRGESGTRAPSSLTTKGWLIPHPCGQQKAGSLFLVLCIGIGKEIYQILIHLGLILFHNGQVFP